MSGLAEKLLERSILALRVKDWERALMSLADAIKYDPDMYEAWTLRGNVMMALERPFDAMLHYDRALMINPNLPDAMVNRGTAAAHLGMFETALASFAGALDVRPSWEAHVGFGDVYTNLMDLAAAETHYRRALEYDETADRHFNLGCVLLGRGKWHEGLREWSYRWRDSPLPPLAYRSLPHWQGEPLAGKTIVLYPEQGYGDEIMGLRFGDPKLLGASRVFVQARTPMLDLARTLATHDVIPLHKPLPHADFSCALLDVPLVLGLDWKTMPRPDRYLAPDMHRKANWKKRMPTGFNVGVCWMSGGHFSTTLSMQRAKSMPIASLHPFKLPGVNLISLQKPIMEQVPPELDLIDWMSEVDDFADTAALISCLDLVITVDTAVAHVAGAIGTPVWNFVRFSGYWPWLAPEVAGSPDYSIWYPGMRLYRQPRLGEWNAPVTQAAMDLRTLVQEDK